MKFMKLQSCCNVWLQAHVFPCILPSCAEWGAEAEVQHVRAMRSPPGEDRHSVELVQGCGGLRHPVWQPSVHCGGAQWHACLHRLLWNHHAPLHLLHPGESQWLHPWFCLYTFLGQMNFPISHRYFSFQLPYLTWTISLFSGHVSCWLEELQPISSCHSLLHQRLFLRRQHWLAGSVPGWSTQRDCVQEWQHHATWGAVVSDLSQPINHDFRLYYSHISTMLKYVLLKQLKLNSVKY